MKIERVCLRSFMNHGDTSLELPAGGVVVITGDNGSGKSAITEAVAWAGWSKTLRGTSPVPPQGEKTIRVELDVGDQVIVREKRAGKVTWTGADRYETNTKANAALADLIGPFEIWRRTHYFNSEVAGFARGTDAERKRLLETLLGIDEYEAGYRRCRDDLKVEQQRLSDLRHQIELTDQKIEGLLERIEDAEDAIDGFSESEAPDLDLSGLDEQLKLLKEWRSELEKESRDALREISGVEALAKQAAKHVERLAGDACPTCAQKIPDALRDELTADYVRAKSEVARVQAAVRERLNEIKVNQGAARDEESDLRAERAEIMRRKAAAETSRQAVDRATAQIERLERKMLEIEQVQQDQGEILEKLQLRVDVLAVSAHVLGTKGFRAQVLGDALAGLEQAANAVLDHMTGGALRVRLHSYTMTAKGKATDSISLGVIGAGGDLGYKACSRGQRQRIDVALVLALAKLSGATGTLWFDEVFDGLDSSGVDRLADLLGDLADQRAVVVITHNREFGKKVRASERWTVADGVVFSG